MLFKEQVDCRGVRGAPVLRPVIATVPRDVMAVLSGAPELWSREDSGPGAMSGLL